MVFLLFPSFGRCWQCTCITHPAGSDGYCIFDSPSLHVPSIWWRQRRSPSCHTEMLHESKTKASIDISTARHTERNGDLFATDATNEHAPINIQWLHPPTPPLPPHCQEQGNPSNFRSIHWLRLTATVSFPKSRFHYKTFFTCFKQRSPSSTDIRNLPADRFRTEKNKRLKT